MSPRILITAADGLVGRELVRDFHAKGIAVRAGIHNPDKAASLTRPGIETTPLDYDSPESIRSAFSGVTQVYVQIPLSMHYPEYARRIVYEAGKVGVTHIVYLSTMGVRSHPDIQLHRWHREAEETIEASGIHFTFLRANALMQNFIRCWQPVSGEIRLPFGQGRVSYVDARDVAAAVFRVLTTGEWFHGKAYSLTGPLAPNLDEITATLSDTIGVTVGYEMLSEYAARTEMESGRMQGWMIQALLELYAVYREDRASSLSASVENLIGRKPRKFREFVNDYRGSFDRLLQREYHLKTVAPFTEGYPRR